MITTKSPTRIDFAGGTLDIFPLYLLHGGVKVLNAAISIETSVSVKNSESKYWLINSKDMKINYKFDNWDDEPPQEIDLIYKALEYFQKNSKTPIQIITSSNTPLGSGLGTSSSLLISFVYSMVEFLDLNWTRDKIIKVANGIETSHIQVPTGLQDYIPALHGGFNSITFSIDGIGIQAINLSNKFLKELTKSSILVYSGISHFSANENWEIFKKRVDGNTKIIKTFNNIKKISDLMENSLIEENMSDFKSLLKKEWDNRKKLYPTVENKMIKLITNLLSNYDISLKACGAGGGGVLLIICEKQDKTNIENLLIKKRFRILEFEFSKTGSKTERSNTFN